MRRGMIDITAYSAYNKEISKPVAKRAEKGVAIMPVLNIRNLPAEVHARLRVRAARAGRSMEAEARAILTAVCTESESRRPASALQDWVDELYAARRPRKVVESLIAERRREGARE
jgi:plasmid stability protein